MVLGHLTVTAAAYRFLGPRVRAIAALPLLPLLLGAYLPDLVDKPLNALVGLSARGYGHSLIVQVAVFAVAWSSWTRRRSEVLAIASGAGAHLLEDWVHFEALFAPLLGPIPLEPGWGFMESFVGFYRRGGALVWIEIAAVVYWLAVIRSWVASPAESGPVQDTGA